MLGNFQEHFGDVELSSINSEDVLDFMSKTTEGKKQITKKLRFALLSAFFNFVKNSLDSDFQSPCDSPALKKSVQGRKNDSDHDFRQGLGR